ncbi:MAG: hypothetical protein APR55_06650 [Methanolinea sp. SDB]|nr:MAG: hypothetical protein APR55_06650 [Methanolinea sp. SDB]
MEITRDNRNVPPIDERITVLERKVKDMEALLKGLTDEMLDLKSVAMRLSKSEDRRTEMRAVKPSSGQQSTVIMQKKTAQVHSGMRIPQPAPEKEPEKMDMIMQPDGTLKPERRKSSDYIVASAGYGKKAKQVRGSGSRSGDMIVAEDEDEEPPTKKR